MPRRGKFTSASPKPAAALASSASWTPGPFSLAADPALNDSDNLFPCFQKEKPSWAEAARLPSSQPGNLQLLLLKETAQRRKASPLIYGVSVNEKQYSNRRF